MNLFEELEFKVTIAVDAHKRYPSFYTKHIRYCAEHFGSQWKLWRFKSPTEAPWEVQICFKHFEDALKFKFALSDGEI